MAFVSGLDNKDPKILGQGAPVGIMEQQIFFTKDATIGTHDPYGAGSNWVRVKGAELKTSEKTNTTAFYDQYDEVGVKQGRVESTFELTQDYYGLSENILTLKNQDIWFAEGLQDDRVLKDATTGLPIFQEINFYKAKMVDFSMDKGDVFKVTGSGKYNTQSTFTVIKGITPVNVAIDGMDTATSGSAYSLTITASDLYNDVIDLSDLTDASLGGEITSIVVEKVSGNASFTITTGANTSSQSLTFSGSAGSSAVICAKIITKNGGSFKSTEKTVTIQ